MAARMSARKFLRCVGVPTVYHHAYSAPDLPPNHRFPMKIFKEIYSVLLKDNIVKFHNVHVPTWRPSLSELCLAHDKKYVADFMAGDLDPDALRRIGLPLHKSFQERTLAEIAGTLLTAELALKHGIACNTAGGTHHAHRSFGSGFCFLNDMAITAMVLLKRSLVRKVLIVDLDVHQGDGTASIFQNEERVFTFSMHCGANFPARKMQSSLDIDVPAGTGDSEYLKLLGLHLPIVLNNFSPDLVIYDAGVDVHEDDTLGKLCLTDDGIFRREMQVLDTCLGFGVPVAANVGGGYSPNLELLARRHCLLHLAAKELHSTMFDY